MGNPEVVLPAPRLDRELVEGADPASSPSLRARARRVTSWRARRRLANAFEHLEEGPGVPVRRDQVRGASDQLRELVRVLRAADRRVSARGMLLARGLLTDGAGPLYSRRYPPSALWWRARDVLREL